MQKTRFYKAFGLIIQSDFAIAQIPETDRREVDVRIVRSDLSGLSAEERKFLRENAVYSRVAGVAAFRITNGELDRKSTRLNSSHIVRSRMPSSA